MHLILRTLKGYACQYGSRLYALGRTRRAMAGRKAVVEDIVERMLAAGKRLGGIIVFVVNMQIVVLHGVTYLLRQQVVVNERLCGLRGKLHHHSSGSVGIHICVLTRYIVVLDVHNVEEHGTGLGLACDAALVAILDVLLCHILALALHQLHLHGILYGLYGHL